MPVSYGGRAARPAARVAGVSWRRARGPARILEASGADYPLDSLSVPKFASSRERKPRCLPAYRRKSGYAAAVCGTSLAPGVRRRQMMNKALDGSNLRVTGLVTYRLLRLPAIHERPCRPRLKLPIESPASAPSWRQSRRSPSSSFTFSSGRYSFRQRPETRLLGDQRGGFTHSPLATGGGLLNNRQIRVLVNDEVSRSNYRTSVVAGYWVAMTAAMAVYFWPTAEGPSFGAQCGVRRRDGRYQRRVAGVLLPRAPRASR